MTILSDLKVKNNKIKFGQSSDKTHTVVLAVVAFLIVGIFIAVIYPSLISSDIYVKYGKDTYKTSRDATVGAVFAKINDGSVTPGNLMSVAGSIITTAAGEPIVYSVNGKVVDQKTFLKNGDTIDATSGQNVVEKTVTTTKEGHVGYDRRGKGPIVAVVTPGKNPITTTVEGEKSGAVVSKKITNNAVKPVVEYKHYRNEQDKVVALTFDDGPSKTYTPKVLAILNKYKVKATFFELGSEVKKYPNISKQVVDSGSQVALHSQNHVRLAYTPVNKINKEIEHGIKTIKKATGVQPTFMRPPYGSVDGTVFDALAQHKLGIGLWSIDTVDWSRPGKKYIIKRAVDNAYPGAVILMHDGGGNRQDTLDALPHIIKAYQKAGYRFVTMDEYSQLMNR